MSEQAGAKQSFLRLVRLAIEPGLGRPLVLENPLVIVVLRFLTCRLRDEPEVDCALGGRWKRWRMRDGRLWWYAVPLADDMSSIITCCAWSGTQGMVQEQGRCET